MESRRQAGSGLSRSQGEEIFKYIRMNKANLLKSQYLEKFANFKHSMLTYKDNLTRMTMLRFSIYFKAFDVTALLLDYASGSDLLDKEVYYDADVVDTTICTTILHLLIDEKQPILIEKLFNLLKGHERFLPYLMLRKKCYVTVIASDVDFVEYLTSFEYAAFRGQQNVVSLFCQYCPCLLGSSDMCNNVLRCAIISKSFATFAFLLEKIRVQKEWQSWENWEITLITAVQSGFVQVVEECYKRLERLDKSRLATILPEAVSVALNTKVEDTVLRLLELGFKEESFRVEDPQKLFIAAIELGLHKSAEKMLGLLKTRHEFEVLRDVATLSLDISAQNENKNIVKLLFHTMNESSITVPESFWNIVANKSTSFCSAVFTEFEGTFGKFCKISLTENKLSALHVAACNNNVRAVAFLRQHGVSFETVDDEGNTPFHCAARSDSVDVVKYLIEQYANINARNKTLKQTPLHLACKALKLNTIRTLLQSIYTNVTKCDVGNNTALHCYVENLPYAMTHDQEVVLELLCTRFYKSSCLDVTNIDGLRAFDILLNSGIEQGIKYFKMANFDVDRALEIALRHYPKTSTIMSTLLQTFESQLLGAMLLERLSNTSILFNFREPVYGNVRNTTALHVFATAFDKELVIKLISNGANVLAIDETRDSVLHVLSTLSILNSEHEDKYIDIAFTILTSYLSKISATQLSSDTSLACTDNDRQQRIKELCQLAFMVLTRIFTNGNGYSVLIHSAYKRAVRFLDFLLQFNISLSELSFGFGKSYELLFDTINITNLCQETTFVVDDYDKLIEDFKQITATPKVPFDQLTPELSVSAQQLESMRSKPSARDITAEELVPLSFSKSSSSSGSAKSLVEGLAKTTETPLTTSISLPLLNSKAVAPEATVLAETRVANNAAPRRKSYRIKTTKKNNLSVLEVIVKQASCAEDDCIRMLDIVPIAKVTAGYCQSYFSLYRTFLCIHLLAITAFTSVLRYLPDIDQSTQCFAHVPMIVFTVVGIVICVYAVLITVVRLIQVSYYFNRTANFSSHDRFWSLFAAVYSAVFAALTFLWWLSMRFCHSSQPYLLSLSIGMGWTMVIGFMPAFKQLHVFTNILTAVVRTDLISFLVVFLVFVIALSCSFTAIINYPPQLYNASLIYQSIYITMNLGNFLDDPNPDESDDRVIFVQFVEIVFASFTAIILLNVLIAMMNDSYRRVVDREHLAWRIQSLRKTVLLKQMFPFVFRLIPFRMSFPKKTISYPVTNNNQLQTLLNVDIYGSEYDNLINIDQQVTTFATKRTQVFTVAEQELKQGLEEIRGQVSRIEAKLNLLLGQQYDPSHDRAYKVAARWKTFANLARTLKQ